MCFGFFSTIFLRLCTFFLYGLFLLASVFLYGLFQLPITFTYQNYTLSWLFIVCFFMSFVFIFFERALVVFHVFCICILWQGTHIHVVPATYFPAFDTMLKVDHTYTISNFQVVANDLVFKPSCHDYMVNFIGGTSVSDVDKHDIPYKTTQFTSFIDIMIDCFKKDLLLG